VPRIRIRPFLAALLLTATAATVVTFTGAAAGLAAAPAPVQDQPELVADATAPGLHARTVLVAHAPVRLAPPRPVAHHRRPHYTGSPRVIGRRMAAARGWTGAQWTCLDKLWTRESGWHVHNRNGSSGAYGIPQSMPAHKMASAGSDWRDNATTQIRWGLSYIASVYGTPCGAWNHSQNYGYY
jgi:hypothetical protein